MVEEKKKDSPFDILSFLFLIFPNFWNFDHPPLNYDIETSKMKRCSHGTDQTHTIEQVCINQVRKETYLTWIRHQCKFSFQLQGSYVSPRKNSPNLTGVCVTESSKKRSLSWSSRQKKYIWTKYICYTSLFRGVCG